MQKWAHDYYYRTTNLLLICSFFFTSVLATAPSQEELSHVMHFIVLATES